MARKISTFRYYLERHIEVDGDHHSHLAMKMVENLCGDNKHYWDDAEEFVLESLRQRKIYGMQHCSQLKYLINRKNPWSK